MGFIQVYGTQLMIKVHETERKMANWLDVVRIKTPTGIFFFRVMFVLSLLYSVNSNRPS